MSNCSEIRSEVASGEQTVVEKLSRLLAVIADDFARAVNEVVALERPKLKSEIDDAEWF